VRAASGFPRDAAFCRVRTSSKRCRASLATALQNGLRRVLRLRPRRQRLVRAASGIPARRRSFRAASPQATGSWQSSKSLSLSKSLSTEITWKFDPDTDTDPDTDSPTHIPTHSPTHASHILIPRVSAFQLFSLSGLAFTHFSRYAATNVSGETAA